MIVLGLMSGTSMDGLDCGLSYPCLGHTDCTNSGSQPDGTCTVSGVDSTGAATNHIYSVTTSVDNTPGSCIFAELTQDNESWLTSYIENGESSGNYSITDHVDLDAYLTTTYLNNTNIQTYFNNLEDRILLYGFQYSWCLFALIHQL